nr:DUF2225 domain-containing protein [Clostridium sp. Marseille-Q2269]
MIILDYCESHEDNANDWKIYKENSPEWLKEKSLLYERKVTCPVCGNVFMAKAVKTSSYRILKKDSDLFIRYSIINPYFYDVWICNECGYAAMKKDFNSIKNFQIDSVKEGITENWIPREYPEIYNVDIAIERFKLSLLNYVVLESPSSKKGFNCLKLAWMYRLKNNYDKENLFLNEALGCLKESYFLEDFPIYGMDRYTTTYLVAELMRRTGSSEEALRWFSNVITAHGISSRLKNLARDQKDLIKEEMNKIHITSEESTYNKNDKLNNKKKKETIFTKF